MSAPSIDYASSIESLPLRHMQKHQGAWLNRRLPLNTEVLLKLTLGGIDFGRKRQLTSNFDATKG